MVSAAPLSRPRPGESLVVVVDIQEKLAPAMPAEALADVVRSARLLIESSRLLGTGLLATEQYPQGLGPTLASLREGLAAAGVTPFAKTSFSALGEPAFADALAHSSPRDVVVIGLEAHVCVFQTVRDLVGRGVRVHVPIDGVASRRDDHRRAGLALCERAGANLTTTETLLFDWLERAGGDAFRAVSKALR